MKTKKPIDQDQINRVLRRSVELGNILIRARAMENPTPIITKLMARIERQQKFVNATNEKLETQQAKKIALEEQLDKECGCKDVPKEYYNHL